MKREGSLEQDLFDIVMTIFVVFLVGLCRLIFVAMYVVHAKEECIRLARVDMLREDGRTADWRFYCFKKTRISYLLLCFWKPIKPHFEHLCYLCEDARAPSGGIDEKPTCAVHVNESDCN